MDGKRESIKMANINEKIEAIYEEVVLKEKINNITIKMDDIKKDQAQLRQIIKEELTSLWNNSEIPTFKIILDKLTNLEEEDRKIIIKNKESKSEIVPINAWKRTKEPIMVDISKMKPKISESADKVLKGLFLLQKEGKF